MSDKHSQTATEYLIILAVVIVIALIVLGVLGGIPSIGGGASESSAKLQLASLRVGIANYKQDSHSTLLEFKNNNPTTIRIDEMWINDKKCTLYPYKAILQQGQSKKITCYGVIGLDEGIRFDYDFNLTYTDLATNAQYVIDPDVKLVGTIAEGSELHTGQSTCSNLDNYGNNTLVSCTSVHLSQDGNADGTAKSFTDIGDNVVRDDNTGLYWTTNESTMITRADAISYCDGLAQGGSINWRLPDIVELTTVMNSGTTGNPTPEEKWASGGGAYYWSSTSQNDPYYWKLNVYDGQFYAWRVGSDSGINAVCVRGSTTGITLSDDEKSFVDVGDGTVVDTDTGLVWTKAANYTSSNYWNNSITYCDTLETGGYTNWRLPTASEGATLIDYSCESAGGNCFGRYMNGVFTHGYSENVSDWQNLHYWTGTTSPSNTGLAYSIRMDLGLVIYVNKAFSLSIRCVRDR